jgi:L-asparagine oxygenase
MHRRSNSVKAAHRQGGTQRNQQRDCAGLVQCVRERGFAVAARCRPDLDTAQFAAVLGAPEMLAGIPAVQSLTPKRIEASTPNLYSGQFGLGTFPFHTDLAHWFVPPRFILLRCRHGDPRVVTSVLPWDQVLLDQPMTLVRRARFRPRRAVNGRLHLLPFAQSVGDNTLWRWDSVFLAPDNQDAAMLADRLKQLGTLDAAERIVLRDPGDVLLIDNWRALHARSDVPLGASDRLVERVYLREIGVHD